MKSSGSIEHILGEERRFVPSAEFQQGAGVRSEQVAQLREWGSQDPEAFWAAQAERLKWIQPWKSVLEWDAPNARWFDGGKINASYNCLDRIVAEKGPDRLAFIWEAESGEIRRLSYGQVLEEVNRAANALRRIGIEKGDRVIVYLPMIPEAAIAMLACARVGAVHSVVFGGFSAEAIRDRVLDSEAKLIITADCGYRRGSPVLLKQNVDAALAKGCPTVQAQLVVNRGNQEVAWQEGRDLWWHEALAAESTECEAEPLESEDPLFILYTSGTTGKPKGIVHSTGGYLVQTCFSAGLVFDLQDRDVYWCSADVGWITGHSYIVYGPMLNGATILLYEGAPDHPSPSRFWEIIERHSVSVFYTAPTAIRAFMKWGEQHVQGSDLSSLRLIGTVGEPINPEAWIWYHRVIGQERCPIVDTWWQTETGSIMIAPLPSDTATKPGSATLPLPGIEAAVVDSDGKQCEVDQGGYLVIRRPWPSMLRGIYGDPKRFQEQYWSQYDGWYFTGDGARVDADGYFWVMGRVDDVMNVAGHRLSTAELESALVAHPTVAEAAVVSAPDEVKGEAIVAFVTLASGHSDKPEADLAADLSQHIVSAIGAIARPRQVIISPSLPKTRSGKIMRRLLRQIAAGEAATGDTTTLEDQSVVDALRERAQG